MHRAVSRVSRAVAVTCLLGATAACATVTRGTKTDFNVESSPPEASVKTSTGAGCASTPCKFKMPRKDGFTVTVSKQGYKPSVTQITTKLSGGGTAGLAGNVLIGGAIGIVVDAANGSMNDLTPNPLVVTLEPETDQVAGEAADSKAGNQ